MQNHKNNLHRVSRISKPSTILNDSQVETDLNLLFYTYTIIDFSEPGLR